MSFSEPCEFVKYEAKTLLYDKFTSISIVPDTKTPKTCLDEDKHQNHIGACGNQTIEDNDTRSIVLYYSTTEVKVTHQELLINFSTFVSAVGGNLGLFIGFSFLGVFSSLFDLIKLVCNRV